MKTKHKYAIGQKVLFNDQIHTVLQQSQGVEYDSDDNPDNCFAYELSHDFTKERFFTPESSILPLIKESDGQVYGTTKPKATRPRKKVFSTDKSGK